MSSIFKRKKVDNVSTSTKSVDLRLQTIILLVGPSGCGKGTFCDTVLIPQLRSQETDKKKLNIQHISSDAIRREILGDNSLSKMANVMMHVSSQAFKMLFTKLRAVTTYPVNADFIIVDTTGISKEFRKDVIDIANENNYNIACVVFDFKDRQDYYTYVGDDDHSKRVTSKQIEKLKKYTMAELNKRDFYHIEKLKSRDYSGLNINIKDFDRYEEHILPVYKDEKELKYTVIGDIHGCYNALIELLEKLEFVIDENGFMSHGDMNNRIVLVGDYVDKGPDVDKVVEFIHKNIAWFNIVIGNHENFIYKFLTGNIPNHMYPPQDVMDNYFDSIKLFEANEDLKEKFFDLFKVSKDFFMRREFIVTHAPCEAKFLGKIDGTSLKNQRNVRYPKERDFESNSEHFMAVKNHFKPFRDEAEFNAPLHIFGHITSRGVSSFKNKWNIDTGAYAGNKLSAISINNNGKPFITSVSCETIEGVEKPEFDFFETLESEKVIDINKLEPREKGRIKWAAENKVNFISGTVSPSDKNMDTNTLESLEEAFEFYKSRKVERVVIQPKYMGSRCNIYLHKDLDKCYATSRNGHVINHIDVTPVFKQLHERAQFREMFDKDNVEIIILDSELMPWAALGKGLIEKDFVTIDKAVNSEIDFLKENKFEETLMGLYEGEYKDSKFEELSIKESKKDLVKKFGSREGVFRNLLHYMKRHIPLSEISKGIDVYSKQLELYGQDGDIHSKPFSILKLVYTDGTEKLFFDDNNEDVYRTVSDDNFIVVDLNSEKGLELAREFYRETTEEMEGVMVKPYKIYTPGLPPCLKVRNERYLTIVYGFDYMFDHKYKKLINKKRIRRKLKTSIKEWEIGKTLLEIPYSEISKENEDYVQAFAKMIYEEKKEFDIDPRL